MSNLSDELSKLQGFEKLSRDTQEFFKEACEQ